jgi:5-(carboxyamino)imidazole ribonucleotide synthase
MKDSYTLEGRIGILGGGQLGKMLCQAASPWHLDTYLMDANRKYPAAFIPHHFVEGDIKDTEDVVNFGRHLNYLTIEIESVSVEGLRKLEEKGVKTFPSAATLALIKDKALQNQFYEQNDIPSPAFSMYETLSDLKKEIHNGTLKYPFVQKLRTDGYDGRGVAIIKSAEDISQLLDGPSIVETAIDINKELAVVVARNSNGEVKTYDPVEMVFHPTANLVEYLQSPAQVEPEVIDQMREISKQIIQSLDHCGILAIEFFLDKKDKLWVNEMAPRPHNSGHHTIEACTCSQYEQLIRAIMNLPLGSTELNLPAVMINLLGADGHQGAPKIEGLEKILKTKGAHLHWYGKKQTRPFRKMGHITITADTLDSARKIAKELQQQVKIVT